MQSILKSGFFLNSFSGVTVIAINLLRSINHLCQVDSVTASPCVCHFRVHPVLLQTSTLKRVLKSSFCYFRALFYLVLLLKMIQKLNAEDAALLTFRYED